MMHGPLLAAQDASGDSLYTIFALKHITPKQGKLYLAEAGIENVSNLAGTPALLVTANPAGLASARAILDVVDSTRPYVVKTVLTGEELQFAPDAAQIDARVTGISVGGFDSLPDPNAPARALVGVRENAMVVAAPTNKFGDIVKVIELLRTTAAANEQKTDTDKAPEPVEPKVAPKPDAPKIEVIDVRDVPDVNEPNEPKEPEGVDDSVKPEKRSMYEPPEVKGANAELSLVLPEQIQIINLIDLVGKHLKLDFIYDPQQIQGEVTLKLNGELSGPLKVKDLYPLLEQVLKFKQFAMTRHGSVVIIVPVGEVLDYDPVLVEADKDKEVAHGDVLVTRMFTLEHITTESAENLLTGLKLGATPIATIADARMLIITDYAYRMPRIEKVISLIDKPGKPKVFRYRQLKYTMAPSLAQKVQALAEQLESVPITVGALPSTPSAPSPRQPNESAAAYAARMRREAAARAAANRSGGGGAAAQQTSTEPAVYLDADERTNRILMIGLPEQLEIVGELIEALDVAQQDLRTLKLYKIENVDAEDARNKLAELEVVSGGTTSDSRRSGRITGNQNTAAAKAAAAARGADSTPSPLMDTGPDGTPLVGEPQVVVIEATNSLLVNATTEQHTLIENILGYVDSTTQDDAMPYVIYPLENQEPDELAGVLEKLIQETIKDQEGKVEQVVKKTDEEIVIVPDPKSFSIIVYASKKNQEWIDKLIKTLDKPRPQVLIDVTLVEVSKSEKFEYDLNLIESFPDLVQTSGLTGGLVEGVAAQDVVSQLLSSDRDRYVDLQSNKGRFTGFYADRHVNALLTLMQEKNYGRVLAKPKILVNDNEEGTISTTDTTYVTKKSTVPLSSTGTAGQPVTPVETSIDYEGYDAGIQMTIQPHISDGQLLRMKITLNRTDFGTITGEKPPDTTGSDLETTVTVPDGSTIILGGMIKLNQSKGGTKVPLLGDLPLVGTLFRSVSNSDLQRKLYVFVKAEIIRPARDYAEGMPDLQRISERNQVAFETFEERFQKYSNIPGIKPEPVDPLKVLDAQ